MEYGRLLNKIDIKIKVNILFERIDLCKNQINRLQTTYPREQHIPDQRQNENHLLVDVTKTKKQQHLINTFCLKESKKI